ALGSERELPQIPVNGEPRRTILLALDPRDSRVQLLSRIVLWHVLTPFSRSRLVRHRTRRATRSVRAHPPTPSLPCTIRRRKDQAAGSKLSSLRRRQIRAGSLRRLTATIVRAPRTLAQPLH